MFLIAPLMAYFMKKGVAARVVLFLVSLALLLIQNIVTPLFAFKNVACFLVYFVLGMLLRERFNRCDRENRRQKHEDTKGEQCKRYWYLVLEIVAGGLLFWMLQWEGWSGYDEIWRLKFGVWIQPVISVLTVQLYSGVTLLKMII